MYADSTGRRRDPVLRFESNGETLVQLASRPEYIVEIGTILYNQWPQWYHRIGLTNIKLVTKDLARTLTTTVPCKFIVLKNQHIIGTVGVEESEIGAPSYGAPWLVDLWVHPDYRSLGLGKQLIQATIGHVKALGYRQLYLWTEDCVEYYKKQGWKAVDRAFAENLTIMALTM